MNWIKIWRYPDHRPQLLYTHPLQSTPLFLAVPEEQVLFQPDCDSIGWPMRDPPEAYSQLEWLKLHLDDGLHAHLRANAFLQVSRRDGLYFAIRALRPGEKIVTHHRPGMQLKQI